MKGSVLVHCQLSGEECVSSFGTASAQELSVPEGKSHAPDKESRGPGVLTGVCTRQLPGELAGFML